MERYDVIVIGAGAAGLTATKELSAAGRKVLVLEAMNRIGGRINTVRERGVVEAGAEFIHGEYAATWDYVREFGMPTTEWKAPDGSAFQRLYGENGGIVAQDKEFVDATVALRKAAYTYAGEDINLSDFLAASSDAPLVQELVSRSIAALEATDPKDLSVLGLAQAEGKATNGHKNFHLPQGYDQLTQGLVLGLDIRLDTPVSEVRWDEQGVEVKTGGGDVFIADRLLFTVSLGVLAKEAITFIPALPASFMSAVGAIGFGDVSKLTLWIEGDIPEFQILTSRAHINFWQRRFGEEIVVVGYSGGPRATELTNLSEEDALAEAIHALEDALDPGIASRVKHARHFTWSDNEYVGGGYSYPKVGMGDAREVLREPMGALYYAGEASNSDGEAATVHGAIEEGRRAARAILST